MKKTLVWIGIIAIVAIWGVSAYNGLVHKDEAVTAAWGQVENNYQRRADLIPNLVATVKGYAQHESSTLEAVVNARAAATQVNGGNLSTEDVAAYQKAQGEVSSALNRLLMVVENYPELKANENFLDLQAPKHAGLSTRPRRSITFPSAVSPTTCWPTSSDSPPRVISRLTRPQRPLPR